VHRAFGLEHVLANATFEKMRLEFTTLSFFELFV
jgi:hypothetical protein